MRLLQEMTLDSMTSQEHTVLSNLVCAATPLLRSLNQALQLGPCILDLYGPLQYTSVWWYIAY